MSNQTGVDQALSAAPAIESKEGQAPKSAEELIAALGKLEKGASPEALLRELATAQNGLDKLKRALVRSRAIGALKGKIPASTPVVDAALDGDRSTGSQTDSQGKAMFFQPPEPWPKAVDGSELLEEIAAALSRHLVLVPGAAVAVSLWVLYAYAFEAFPICPYLCIKSATMRCGKTNLMILLNVLLPRAMIVSSITPAALFRAIEKYKPCLLIDEADRHLGDDKSELHAILNAGHTRATAFVIRAEGEENEPTPFSTFAPKAVAGIGRRVATLEDRSIVIEMRRKGRGEKVERLRQAHLDFSEIRRKATRWAEDHEQKLRSATPEIPKSLNDRAADNWEPLLTVADTIGSGWSKRAREAAEKLSGEADLDLKEMLLEDLARIFDQEGEELASQRVCDLLAEREDRPWGDWRGKTISPHALARQVKAFGIRPKQVWIAGSGGKVRGYQKTQFDETFARYLGNEPVEAVGPNNDGASLGIPNREEKKEATGSKNAESPITTGILPGLPLQSERSGGTKGNADSKGAQSVLAALAGERLQAVEIESRAELEHGTVTEILGQLYDAGKVKTDPDGNFWAVTP